MLATGAGALNLLRASAAEDAIMMAPTVAITRSVACRMTATSLSNHNGKRITITMGRVYQEFP